MVDLILNILYIYIAVFSVYYFLLGIRSLNDKKFRLQEKYAKHVEDNKLCVIVYSHNNYEMLKLMLQQLKNQNYGAENYFTYVILDNCNDHSEELLLNVPSLKLLNLNDGVTVGKEQAISILIESLRLENSIDAYVFIDVERYIEDNFLTNVNNALTTSDAVSGATIIINSSLNFTEKIKAVYQKYVNDFIKKSRALLSLSDFVDSSLFAVKKKVLERTENVPFKDINSEMEYSFVLSSLGYSCKFNPTVKAYTKSYNYNFTTPSLSCRLSLFKKYFTSIFFTNIVKSEQICSLISPNVLFATVLSLFYLAFSYKYYFIINFIIVFTIFSMLLLGVTISIVKAEIFAKDFLYLICYPVYSFFHILKNLPPCRFVKKISGITKIKNSTQKYSVRVFASDGKNNIPCKLELISDNNLAVVVFKFKKKKFVTDKHIRMLDAISELTTKLKDYGFTLKICHSCKYFQNNVDGSKNMVKGFCDFNFKDRKPDEELETLLWNACSMFTPVTVQSPIERIMS